MEASDIAAWWGAIIASIVLLWDIFKWMSKGASVAISAMPNMQTVNSSEGKLDNNKLIFVEAINTGDLPTTITHLVLFQYETEFRKLLNKPKNQAVIINPETGNALPYLLNPGARWTGSIDQNDISEKLGNDGVFYCGIIHSTRKKPVLMKVNLNDKIV